MLRATSTSMRIGKCVSMPAGGGMFHLPRVSRASGDDEESLYPFSVPAVAALRHEPLVFDAPVTFLVGGNGSGKSALLEGWGCAAGFIAIGGEDPRRDPTMRDARSLGRKLRLTWGARTQRGFFLRAEDFFGF